MQIAEPLPQDGPIATCDFIFDDKDNEEESVEILFDNDNGSDGVAKPISQCQRLRIQSQFQSQSSKHVSHYSSLNLEAMHIGTFPGFALQMVAKFQH